MKQVKPRFDYVILRKGGSHKKSKKAERQKVKKQIREEIR